jgi:anti-anti-sigma factor
MAVVCRPAFQKEIGMNITERDQDGTTVFTLEGRVDTQGAVDMDLSLNAAVEGGKNKMVLDMAGVNYISSAGLRTLADVVTKNREAGGDLKLVAVNRRVLRVLRIIGFDRFFSTYDTVDEAVADF